MTEVTFGAGVAADTAASVNPLRNSGEVFAVTARSALNRSIFPVSEKRGRIAHD